MSTRAARTLSIPELFQELGEKLGDGCSLVREISVSFTSSMGLLESEINGFETRAHDILRFLRGLKNRLRPVNRLPPEIISYIARCALWAEDGVGVVPIIPLTHVCQYWRDSIVSAPENWTRIYNSRGELTKLSLERAKAAPLHVFLDFGSRGQPSGPLLPHAHNIFSLCCTDFYSTESLTNTLPNFPESMPNLQSLTLRASYRCAMNPLHFSTNTTLRELMWQNLPLCPSILGLRTLTEFNFRDHRLDLHVDTLLRFLEENRSLERASLDIAFEQGSLCRSRRQIPANTSLQYLLIRCYHERDAKSLISNIALREGAVLEIADTGRGGLRRILSGISTTHLPGLSSPISMEYQFYPRRIRLLEPDGSFLYTITSGKRDFGEEFPLLPLASVREACLKCYGSWISPEFRLSPFPSLEILVVDGHEFDVIDDEDFDPTSIGHSIALSLSPMSLNPAPSPSLKTLAFLGCEITYYFIEKLAQVILDRKNHTPTSLHRVVFVSLEWQLPSKASVSWLSRYVPIVETLEGKELPKDLS
ncbi:hypothetical protein BJ322DRAFT_861510 [Thelephora terrestris]|uniref:F-box domain-containing protein n=1 Tax=Thelephora terrestris TaxID=56493 RepID=A0A9P6HDI0_9AGAM|nr:hypothetical protein BJ322DRAFT_861510 [Thelephora terrestris]